MWQALYEEAKESNFIILAVAEESRGAETAREWIEAAKPSYVTLIERDHHVADPYNMVKVPQAGWITEDGRIVWPAAIASSSGAIASASTTPILIDESPSGNEEAGHST